MSDIVQQLLEASPPGEIKDIEADLRKITDGGTVDSVKEISYRAYNHSQMISVEHEGRQVLISEHGVVDGNRYLDPRNKQVITVDHIAQTAVSAEAAEEGANEALRAAIDTAFQEYVAGQYPSAASAVYPSLTMCVSSGLFAPAKFWNGRWTSVWQYNGGKLTGAVKVHVHYFEKGNVHKTVNFSKELTVAEDAAAIVGAVQAAELEFHRQVIEEAASIKEAFKSLRRALPVTKKEIDWKKIQSEARVGKELSGLMAGS